MTLTRKATPLHALVFASLLVATGGAMRINVSLPVYGSIPDVLFQDSIPNIVFAPVLPAPRVQAPVEPLQLPEPVVLAEADGDAPVPTVKMSETTAQRRARFAPYILAAAQAAKVEAALIEAVITAESAFNPTAVSRAGAVGLMQLMPETAERYDVTDRWDPAQNILGGARYLNFLLHKFRNPKLAIAAYNAGEGNVKKHGNKIPPFKETRKYVPKVLAYYTKYRDES
jgi:soluble lytic murein transglycosylase-like protein